MNEVGSELPSVWTPKKEGDSIQGIYIRKKENVGKNKANIYILNVDETMMSVWGSTVLDDKMDHVSVMDEIRITFLGDDEDKGYHKYKVEREEDEEESSPETAQD